MVSVRTVRRLPGPVAELSDGQLHADCRARDSAVFFRPNRERGPARNERDQRAEAVCQRCPVIAPCRQHARAVLEPYGVRGGLTADRRAAILRHPSQAT
jgi:WhiB family redox-sensing transcriptional regulator